MPESDVDVRSNPFPGLRPFSSDEANLFFGRTACTREVVARLKENRFVAVTGASGGGKTSLLMAGVIPALLKENIEEKRSWSFLVIRPAVNPVDHLASQAAAFSAGAGFAQVTVESAAASLRNRTRGLTELFGRIRKSPRQQIVIIADQFEDLFRLNPSVEGGERDHDVAGFIGLLTDAVADPGNGLHVLIAMRSEDVSECAGFAALTALMNRSSYLVPNLDAARLREVIEEPLRLSGAPMESSLTEVIIRDLGERHDRLPVLQHLLMRMWNQWYQAGDPQRPVGISDYEAAGRIAGAISLHAGQALESFDERHRHVCERLFRTITIRTDEGRELRNPEKISAIAEQTGFTRDEIITVAELFRSDGYSFLTPPPGVTLTGETMLDLTHESIIRNWDRLREWMDAEESSVKLYRQLAAAAVLYQEGKGRLWSPPDLLLAIRWREENRPTLAWAAKIDPAFERTMLFLKNSEEEYAIREEHARRGRERKEKRFRFISMLMGLLVLVTLVALGAVYSSRISADRHRQVALELQEEALAINDMLSDSLDVMMKALTEAESRLGEAETPGLKRMEEAEKRIRRAVAAMREMDESRAKAEEKLVAENRNRMLVVARSLAVRSLKHAGSANLQVLLAWQAYVFNERYSGIKEDADIFAGLYEVARRYGNRYVSRVTPDGAEVTAMAAAGDGGIYTADTRGRIIHWRTGRPAGGFDLVWSGGERITSMSLSPDEAWLACAAGTDRIQMIPLADNVPGYRLNSSDGDITALQYADNGLLYSSASEGAVTEWDMQTGRGRRIITDHSVIVSLDIADGSRLVAALTADGRVLLCRIGENGQQKALNTGERIITAQQFMPGSEQIATGDDEGRIELWNTATGEPERIIRGHAAPVRRIGFSRIDRQMVTADDQGEIRLWNVADLSQPPVVFTDSNDRVIRLAFSDNGKAFLAATPAGVDRRPAHVSVMTEGLCDRVNRNLTAEEWAAYVGADIPWEATCPEKEYSIRVREIRGAY